MIKRRAPDLLNCNIRDLRLTLKYEDNVYFESWLGVIRRLAKLKRLTIVFSGGTGSWLLGCSHQRSTIEQVTLDISTVTFERTSFLLPNVLVRAQRFGDIRLNSSDDVRRTGDPFGVAHSHLSRS